ncbi:MAG: 16S rRNA (cytosine(1402)-N(4))-methyltransferase RsmH [Actinomycetota bacterium]|nr:16S rRNA (cytosine(1402)-N(4))-methyltransferase RsmH [Actinomycetota bacterium]
MDLLGPAVAGPDPVMVDATVGLGGHAHAMLAAHPGLRLIGIDRDERALQLSASRLAEFADRTDLVKGVYDELPEILRSLAVASVEAVLFDFGVSSLQLDEVARGFAYAQDAPLDMRMDPSSERTAADILNTYPATDLARILASYGEERFARRIAAAIVRERKTAPWQSTARLADVVRDSIPAATRRTGGHPAKRTFQALRIEVNDELRVAERAVPAAIDALSEGGRIAVLSYHSLEDRIVKRALTARATGTTPLDLPVELAGHGPQLRLLTRGAELPSAAEVEANPRAASARLRAAERIRAAA